VLQGLGRFRKPLGAYLDHSLTFGRTRRQGLYLAALLHDVGKSTTFTHDSDGSIRFLGHEAVGASMTVGIARRLALSLAETAELERLVADHMRPGWMEKEGGPSPRSIYRFFRLTQAAGVGIALLSLADLFGKHVPPVPEAAWSTRVESVRTLLLAWFEERRDRVDPDPLLNGEAVMRLVGIPSGPNVGRLLEDLREAQVEGGVRTVAEAEAFLRNRYEQIVARPDAGGRLED